MSKYASRSCKRYQTLLKMCRTSSKYRACGRKPHRLFRLEGTSVPRHIHSTAPCLRGSCRTPHLYLVLLSETHTKKKKSLRFDVAWFFFRSFFLSFFRPFFFLLFSFSYFFFRYILCMRNHNLSTKARNNSDYLDDASTWKTSWEIAHEISLCHKTKDLSCSKKKVN